MLSHEFSYIFIGFTAMLAGGFWGMGGGWYIVPALLITGVEKEVAVPASLLQMCGSTFLTVLKQFKSIGWKRGEIGLAVALPLCAMAFIGGFFGKPVQGFVSHTLKWPLLDEILFITLMLWIAYNSFKVNEEHVAKTKNFKNKPVLVVIAGFIVGVLSAFLGIGGGTLNRPLLTNVLHVKEQYTGKICRLAVFLTAISGSFSYLFLSKTHCFSDSAKEALYCALFLVIGGSIGYPLGAFLHSYTVKAKNDHNISKSFSVIALIVGVSLLLKLLDLKMLSHILLLSCGGLIIVYMIFITLHNKKTIKSFNQSE